MTVIMTGTHQLRRKLEKLAGKADSAVDGGVYATAQNVRSHAIKSIQEQSIGRVVTRYTQGGKPYKHVAAGAGQAPNTDTGKLVASIAVEKQDHAQYEVGSNLDYSAALEMGTVFMAPRPWLDPALQAKKDNMRKNIHKVADVLLKAVK